ncbi:MAG: IS5/IS1182 family transposase [Nanoarchaeota archaeon]|nr:IS5/IS1182 family transposase [Nanoarchaeota archaeon]
MSTERWGKKFEDKRDWKVVNDEWVVRGEFLLDLDWVKSWGKELRRMNKNKVGAPYEFPESLIRLQAVWGQWVDYRGLEGITRKLCKYGLIPKYNDFSTIHRRITKMETDFELPKEKNISVSSDGSGMQMNNSGEYKGKKYGGKLKPFIKVTISADPIRKKLLDCEVDIPGGYSTEAEIALSHLEKLIELGFDVDKFWGDGAFDMLDLFNLLAKYNIKSAIKPHHLKTSEKPGSAARKKEVEKLKEKGYKTWAEEKKYGQRWTGTEGIFSAVKRKYGEKVRSTKIENMLKEIKRKFWAYDKIKNYKAT